MGCDNKWIRKRQKRRCRVLGSERSWTAWEWRGRRVDLTTGSSSPIGNLLHTTRYHHSSPSDDDDVARGRYNDFDLCRWHRWNRRHRRLHVLRDALLGHQDAIA